MDEKYTTTILREQYNLHKNYVIQRKTLPINIRLPFIPEDISENIIKNIIHTKLGDKTSSWDCKGDLKSLKEGVQECKCFTSDGPISFTPSSNWNVIYFLDARKWLDDWLILYRVPLERTSDEWKSIKVNKIHTFEDQTIQGRRPRIIWNSLKPQIENHIHKVFEGSFEEIFS